ncbi:MAG: magnesium transporter [Candidatus Stahlbacteria bacterium]|nr:MAG: magnesium transporter [Candidatus Stahlbacteria bacterium]
MDADFLDRVEDLLEQGKTAELKEILERIPARHLARVLERLDRDDLIALFRLIDTDKAADVILELDDATLDVVLRELENERISKLVEELDSDDAADIVAEMSAEDRAAVIARLPADDRRDLRELLKFPPDTAGGRMAVEFLRVRTTDSVEQVVRRLRRRGPDPHYSSLLFVTDRKGHFEGALEIDKLLFHSPRAKIRDLAVPYPVKAFLLEDQESVARKAEKAEVPIVPVVDEQETLRGRITIEAIIAVIREETTEDIYRSGGVSTETSLFESPVRSAGRRLPWLLVNLGTAFVAASVIGLFQNTIRSLVAVTIFLPIVAGLGGNAGSQTVVMVIRSLALGEITSSDAWRLLRRQLLTCFLLGLCAGILVGVGALIFRLPIILAPLVFLALVINIIIGGIVGTLVPMILRRLKFDPSLASSIFLTATTDTLGFLVLLGLATLALQYFPA